MEIINPLKEHFDYEDNALTADHAPRPRVSTSTKCHPSAQ